GAVLGRVRVWQRVCDGVPVERRAQAGPTPLFMIKKAIIIAAGRGRRLMPTTADTPKCYAEVHGKRLLDHALAAFRGAGITDICFIGGYQIDKVKRDYPQLTFRHNTGWEYNNILLSLMHAEDQMGDGFVCCY